jgi:hypothetical protein
MGRFAADLQERQVKQLNVKLYPEVSEAYFMKPTQPTANDGSAG